MARHCSGFPAGNHDRRGNGALFQTGEHVLELGSRVRTHEQVQPDRRRRHAGVRQAFPEKSNACGRPVLYFFDGEARGFEQALSAAAAQGTRFNPSIAGTVDAAEGPRILFGAVRMEYSDKSVS